jgi:hypothetical protein
VESRQRACCTSSPAKGRLQPEQWICIERLRGTLPGRLFASRLYRGRSRTDRVLPVHYHGRDGSPGSGRICSHRHWTRTDADSSDWHPGHESLGEPSTEYRTGHLCGRMGALTALDVLGGSHSRWSDWRSPLRGNLRGRTEVLNDISTLEENSDRSGRLGNVCALRKEFDCFVLDLLGNALTCVSHTRYSSRRPGRQSHNSA